MDQVSWKLSKQFTKYNKKGYTQTSVFVYKELRLILLRIISKWIVKNNWFFLYQLEDYYIVMRKYNSNIKQLLIYYYYRPNFIAGIPCDITVHISQTRHKFESLDKSYERIKMTKRAVLCPWQSDQESGSSISDGLETTSDLPHLFVPIRLALRVVPSRFINYPRPLYDACDRNYHFIRRFASVRANLSMSFRLSFFWSSTYRHPFFAFIVIAGTPVPVSAWTLGAYSRGRENPHKSLCAGPGNTNHSHGLVKRAVAFISPLLSTTWKYSPGS